MKAVGGLRNVHPLPQGSVALTRGLNGKDECRGFWEGGFPQWLHYHPIPVTVGTQVVCDGSALPLPRPMGALLKAEQRE